jgi:hypothetical protein
LPRAIQNPGNFPVQFRGSKITDAEASLVSLRLESIGSDEDTGSAASFTNSTYADLDALTGTALSSAVSVTVITNERVLVLWRAEVDSSGGVTYLSYRVSGATTASASDTRSLRNDSASNIGAGTFDLRDGLTPGENTFELQARVTAGTGSLQDVFLVVIPI